MCHQTAIDGGKLYMRKWRSKSRL